MSKVIRILGVKGFKPDFEKNLRNVLQAAINILK